MHSFKRKKIFTQHYSWWVSGGQFQNNCSFITYSWCSVAVKRCSTMKLVTCCLGFKMVGKNINVQYNSIPKWGLTHPVSFGRCKSVAFEGTWILWSSVPSFSYRKSQAQFSSGQCMEFNIEVLCQLWDWRSILYTVVKDFERLQS